MIKYRQYIIGICIWVISLINCYAQIGQIDSLRVILKTAKEDTNKVKTLDNLSRCFESSNNHKAADSVAELELKLSQKLNYKPGIILSYRNKGSINLNQDKYSDALNAFMLCVNSIDETKGNDILASAYGKIGVIYGNEGNYPEALKYQLKCLKIREELKDKLSIDITCENIGNVYKNLKDYKNALAYQSRSLEIAKEINDTQGQGYVYGDIGSIYYDLHNYSEALKNQLNALEINKSIADRQGTGNAYVNIGNIYLMQGSYTEALDWLFRGLKVYKEIDSKFYMGYAYVNIGYTLFKKKEYLAAKAYLDSTISLAKSIGDKDITEEAFLDKSKLDSATGNTLMAYEDYKRYTVYRDSITSEANTKKVVSEQMQFDFDKKQAEQKAEQDQKDAITATNKRRQEITIYSVSGGLLLVLLFSFVLFSRFRLIRKQKALIEKQKAVVEEQKQMVEHQKAVVDEKNKDITDSIHYASRIQKALLTTDDYISKYIKEYFILFKPRDIVSGDFYWAFNSLSSDNSFYLACCDCTGHGVPGAFMSLLNISMLNETVIERKITKPDLILNDIRHHIIKALNPDGSDKGKDGMDCSLCAFDFKNNTLQTSCANNPVWIVKQDKSLVEIAPDKMPVGIQYGNEKPFTMNTTQLDKGDCVYLFTDGYADQFGGPKGKKFKYKQFQELLLANAHKPMDEQKKLLDEMIEAWKGSLEQVDDVLVMGIRV